MACVTASVLNRERKAPVADSSPGFMKKTTSARWSAPTQSSVIGAAASDRRRRAAFGSPRRCRIRMSLSTYARMAHRVPAVERAAECLPRPANRRLRLFLAAPGAERLRPHVVAVFGAEPARPEVDGFFEELPFGHPQLARHAVHFVQGRFIQPGGEDLLHT